MFLVFNNITIFVLIFIKYFFSFYIKYVKPCVFFKISMLTLQTGGQLLTRMLHA